MNILIKIESIFHFKAFGMINLQYEIRICQKIYNRVTMTVYVKCVVWFNVNKTLVLLVILSIFKIPYLPFTNTKMSHSIVWFTQKYWVKRLRFSDILQNDSLWMPQSLQHLLNSQRSSQISCHSALTNSYEM